MLSSLARANRAYCHGMRHGHHEVQLSQSACSYGRARAEDAIRKVLLGHNGNNDEVACKVAEYMSEQGRYAPVHPTTRNAF